MTIFDIIVWAGAALTLAGVALLVWCIVMVARLRRKGADDATLRAGMRRAVAANMGALAASSIGLMLVVTGLLLQS